MSPCLKPSVTILVPYVNIELIALNQTFSACARPFDVTDSMSVTICALVPLYWLNWPGLFIYSVYFTWSLVCNAVALLHPGSIFCHSFVLGMISSTTLSYGSDMVNFNVSWLLWIPVASTLSASIHWLSND